jgi:hypothetical protein
VARTEKPLPRNGFPVVLAQVPAQGRGLRLWRRKNQKGLVAQALFLLK